MPPIDEESRILSEPFLASKSEFSTESPDVLNHVISRTRIRFSPITFHSCIAVIYTIVIIVLYTYIDRTNLHASHNGDPSSLLYSPGEEAIEHKIVKFHPTYAGNPYAGDPRPEHDKAWSDIVDNVHIRITEEELQRINRTSIAFRDGSGYLAKLGAYHELHCVKWIRRWIHREHYWPALEGILLEERKVHIEYLRLNAMCHGSRRVTTFEWYGSLPKPTGEQDHVCVDWEKFDAWNTERRVDLYDVDALAGRPEPQSWELIEHDVRIGLAKPRPGQDGGIGRASSVGNPSQGNPQAKEPS